MRTHRSCRKIRFHQRWTALELVQLLLECCQLAGWHKRDPSKRAQSDKSRILAKRSFCLVLGKAQSGSAVLPNVGGNVVLFKLGQGLPVICGILDPAIRSEPFEK